MDERRQRVVAAAKEVGADWAVLTSADAICYATGHIVSIEWGTSPFSGGANVAVIGPDGQAGLVVPNHEVMPDLPDVITVPYTGFAYQELADLRQNYRVAVAELAKRLGLNGTLAVEGSGYTAELASLFTDAGTVEIGAALQQQRATKTADEIALLTRSAQAAAVGQNAARAASVIGETELSAFGRIRSAIENFAGERCVMAGDYVSGIDRAAVGLGWANSRILKQGDPIVCDLAPRVAGYWGDSCSSFTLGRATGAYQALFYKAKSALDLALSEMRSGLKISALDKMLRNVVEADGLICHHHMGHSIGTSVHEWPRILPVEHTELREDMVLMVEPGCYQPGIGGVRLEWMIHVTANGARPLAPFDHVVEAVN